MSKIAIIGYGNVGYHLNQVLQKDHAVTVFSRNPKQDSIKSLEDLDAELYDFIFLCVPDDAVKKLAESFKSKNSIVVHTSGSRPMSDLESHTHHGVFYPLQTFSKEKQIDFSGFPIFIEGNQYTEDALQVFALSFCKDVRLLSSAHRAQLHLAAVFACNFSNHMFHIAENILKNAGLEFKDVAPLVQETIEKAITLNPSNAQTGPAVRNDMKTIAGHLDLLKDEDWKILYKLITENIQKHQ
ncbi:MAG: DUF2520 domain-containing protein [Ekhidna sp.]